MYHTNTWPLMLLDRYDNVTLSSLVRVTIRSHSMQWSSARSDSHRAVFCPNSVEVVGKINGGER